MKKYPYYGLKAYIEITEGDTKRIYTEKDIKHLIITRPNDGSSISFGQSKKPDYYNMKSKAFRNEK